MLFDENGNGVDFRYIATNPAFEHHVGLPDVIGKRASELFPNLEKRWAETYGRIAMTGRPERFVDRSEAMGQWLDIRAFRLGNPVKRNVGVLFSDITRQKMMEEELRHSYERMSLAADAAQIGLWGWDIASNEQFWDEKTKEIFGVSPEVPISSQTWADIVHPDDLPMADQACGKAIATGQNYVMEYRIIRPDGTIRWVQSRGKPYYDEAGNPLQMRGINFDITGRKQMEEALQGSEKRYRMLYESLRDPFVQVDMDGRIIAFNDLYCRMLGYSPEEITTLTYQELTPERWHAFEEEIVRNQIIPNGYSDVYEKEYRRKDGTIIPIELRSILYRDADGHYSRSEYLSQPKATHQPLRLQELLRRLKAHCGCRLHIIYSQIILSDGLQSCGAVEVRVRQPALIP